jgi:hypothetical protein
MPKTESEAVATVAKARASFAAYKGHFTRALKTFDRQVALVLSTEPTAQAVTALDKAHETFLDRYDKACKALDGLIDASIAAGEADDHTDDERDALDDGYSKVEEVFMDAASRLSRGVRRAQAPTAAAAVAPAAGGAAANVVREAKGLKPRDLLTSDTHVALREWLASFRIYYDASKFEHATDAMKHGYFYACMEDKLAFRVRSAATATSAVLNTPGDDPDPTSLETLLREQFDMQDSLFARRYRLMGNCHKPGTRFTDWMNQYTAESDECDLAAMTPDLFLAGQFTAKCADPELQKELMKTDGTLKAIREAAVAYERRSADLGTYKDKASSGSSGHISAIRGDCQRCGGTCPSGAKCPADDSSCMYCGKRGHWAGVCRKRQSDNGNSGGKEPGKSSTARQTAAAASPRRRITKRPRSVASLTTARARRATAMRPRGRVPSSKLVATSIRSSWSRRRRLARSPFGQYYRASQKHAHSHRTRQRLRAEDCRTAGHRRLPIHHLAQLDWGVRPLAQGRSCGSAEAFLSHWQRHGCQGHHRSSADRDHEGQGGSFHARRLHRRHRQARANHRLGGSHSSRRHPSELSRASQRAVRPFGAVRPTSTVWDRFCGRAATRHRSAPECGLQERLRRVSHPYNEGTEDEDPSARRLRAQKGSYGAPDAGSSSRGR